ncbi:hypothetical protein VINE108274_23870 [Vibrio neptunius]
MLFLYLSKKFKKEYSVLLNTHKHNQGDTFYSAFLAWS